VTAERCCSSSSSHSRIMLLREEGIMSAGRGVGDVMVVRRREMGRAVGPIRAMDPLWNRKKGRIETDLG
jgi:hypothetical protein